MEKLSFKFDVDIDLENDQEEIPVEKLIEGVRSILEHLFSHSEKQKIEIHDNRLNFCCPFCGDSKTSHSKRRGNIYLEGMNYFCYNCNKYLPLSAFIATFSDHIDISSTVVEHLQSQKQTFLFKRRIKEGDFYTKSLLETDNLKKIGVSRQELKKAYGLIEADFYPEVWEYLENRGQSNPMYYLYNLQRDTIIILNCDYTGENILSFQERTFRSKNRKFFTSSLLSIYDHLGIENTPPDELLDLTMLYGILDINLLEDIYVLEGPMDAYLLNNAIALTGAGKSLPFLSRAFCFFFDLDSAGKKFSFKYLEKGFRVFLWDKFIEEEKFPRVTEKLDYTDIVRYYIQKGKPIPNIKKYFSNNPFDGAQI